MTDNKPWVIGPTWSTDESGEFILPERTLGWGVIQWLYEYVLTPGGPHAGQPFLPTMEQVRFILWWYAVDDRGRFVYRTGVLRRMKGWGKDPLAGALALVELCGPTDFSHFDENGKAIGKVKYDPWVQIAAVSQDQPLALDTEVPTPAGWTTVGDLTVGDYVYGSDGEAHRVERETEVLEGLDCYKVRFDDGTEVVASASHGWTTERLNGHGDKYEVVTQTTEELAATVRGSKNRKRHRIPVVGFEGSRSQHRWVESVEKVESVPVKCIGIDTEDHLFQVTRQRILTHNTRNTFTLFSSLVSPRLKEEHGIDLFKTLVYDKRGKMIEGVTSSPLALEGKRPTFVIMNETQWWVESNDGPAMASVIEGNVTKSAYGTCRSLSICNAHVPGQDSVGENDWDAYNKIAAGNAIDNDMLYDALEAPPDTPISEIPPPNEDPEGFEEGIERLKKGIEVARGDAAWLDVEIIVSSILDIRNTVSESRRKYLNQVNASEDSWISPTEWDRLIEPVKLEPGDKITLGFDGSRTSDHTALAACRIEDGAVFLLRNWDPENYKTGEIPREEVDAAVRSAFERYDVVAMRADVFEFEAYVDAWGKDYKRKLKINSSPNNPAAYDMRGYKKKFALDCERFLDAVLEGEVIHNGDPALKWYITNCHRHPTNFDAVTIRKESKDSSRKIDGAVTAVLAYGARQEFMLSKKYRGSGRGGAIL